MLKIGEFSKATGVTIKTLCYYERLGLIRPYWIDKYSGYRYYQDDQIERIKNIRGLKWMGFPLRQIQKLLLQNPTLKEQRLIFEEKRRDLLQQIDLNQNRLATISLMLSQMENKTDSVTSIKEKEMALEIKSIPMLKVSGLLYVGKNENNEIPQLWDTFMKHPSQLWPGNVNCYGICRFVKDSRNDEFEYLAGFEHPEGLELPADFVTREVPACQVAVFKHIGSAETLHDTYSKIYKEWLPSSGYKPLETGFDFEVYTDEFDNFAPHSIMYIYVPVIQQA